MLPIFLAALVVAAISLGLVSFMRPYMMEDEDAFFASFLLTAFISFPLLGAAVLSVPIVAAVRFYRGMFSDEGYLTQSFPVSTHTQIIGRLLVTLCMGAIMVILAAAAIGGCCILMGISIFDASIGDWFEIAGLFDFIGIAPDNPQVTLYAILYLLFLLVSAVCVILTVYAAFAVGCSFTGSKVGRTIVFIFVFFIGRAVLTGIVDSVVTLPLLESEVGPTYSSTFAQMGMDTLRTEMISTGINLALTLAVCGLFYWLTYHFSTKKLNLQ